MILKIALLAFSGALLLASHSMCKAASTDVSQAGHRKSAKNSPTAGAKPYGAGLNEEQSLRALESEISRKVGSKIQESDYPEEARRQGWSGTALVGVLVDGNGKIKQVSVRRTSGLPVLDDQAVRMVGRVSIWWIPQRLHKREVNVAVPVGFYVRDADGKTGRSGQAATSIPVANGTQAFGNGGWKSFLDANTSLLYWKPILEGPYAMIPVVDSLLTRADHGACPFVIPSKYELML